MFFGSIWTNDAKAMASGFWRRDSGVVASGFAEYWDEIPPMSYRDFRRRRTGIFWECLSGIWLTSAPSIIRPLHDDDDDDDDHEDDDDDERDDNNVSGTGSS